MPEALSDNALISLDRARLLGSGLASILADDLTFAINALSNTFEKECGRPLHQVVFTTSDPELCRGEGRESLQLSAYPVSEVEEVLVSDIEETGFSSAQQFLKKGILYHASCWPWSVTYHGDLTRDPDFSRARYNIAIAYTGGYVTSAQGTPGVGEVAIPADLEMAFVRELSDLFSGARTTGRIASESTPGGYSVRFAISSGILLSAETRLVLASFDHPDKWVP